MAIHCHFVILPLISKESREPCFLSSTMEGYTIAILAFPLEPKPLRKYRVAFIPKLMHATNIASNVGNV